MSWVLSLFIFIRFIRRYTQNSVVAFKTVWKRFLHKIKILWIMLQLLCNTSRTIIYCMLDSSIQIIKKLCTKLRWRPAKVVKYNTSYNIICVWSMVGPDSKLNLNYIRQVYCITMVLDYYYYVFVVVRFVIIILYEF